MNERDLQLLQAAAAADSTVNGDNAPDAVVDDDNNIMEQAVADLSADEINAALQALVGEMEERHDDKSQDSQPSEKSCSVSNTTAISKFDFDTTEDSLENLKKLLGLDDNPSSDTIDGVLRQNNGSTVTNGMDQSPAINHEGHVVDLQKNLSGPASRANSPSAQDTAVTEVDPQATASLVNWLSTLVSSPSTNPPAPSVPAPLTQSRGRTRRSPIPDPFEDPVKAAERDRVRVENRERKKKWRTQNQERNKDNDLRCRVTKRAAQLYGTIPTTEKIFWIEREFNRRRFKRVTRKEQRIIDNPANNNPNAGSSSVFPAFSSSNSSSPPPDFSPIITDKGGNMHDEGAQPGDDMVEVMRALAALSGEPSMFVTLMSVAVASGYDQRALQAHYERLTPGDSGDDGGENQDFAETTENTVIPVDPLNNAWIPEAEATPAPSDTPKRPQQDFAGPEELQRINHVEAGFEALVASLESGLKECDTNEENNEDPEVKPEPVSPNQLPADHWTPAQTLEELGFDNLPEESLNSAIAELLKSQSARQGGVVVDMTEAGQVEFNDEDIQRLLAEGGEDVEMLLSSMEADESAAAATQTQGVCERVGNFAAGEDDRIELAQQMQAGHTPNPSPKGQPEEGESADFTMDSDDLPIADGMTLEEINSLLADLNSGGDSGPMQLDIPVESQPQQQAVSPIHVPAPSLPPFDPDPDTSTLYTKDTIVAIFKAILDLSPVPIPPLKGGIKRSSPSPCGNNSPTKRQRGHTPTGLGTIMNAATMSALNQLSGLLSNNGYMQHSPPAVPVQSQAYVASFGTTDGMNKRLMAMKPPPYRSNGSSVSGCGVGIGVTGVQSKRKTGEEEKKVRAMGFPPLMAGMGRKA